MGGVWGSAVVVWYQDGAEIQRIVEEVEAGFYGPRRIGGLENMMVLTCPGLGARRMFAEPSEVTRASETQLPVAG
jgi:hypothetical protein